MNAIALKLGCQLYAYFGISGNSAAIKRFRFEVEKERGLILLPSQGGVLDLPSRILYVVFDWLLSGSSKADVYSLRDIVNPSDLTSGIGLSELAESVPLLLNFRLMAVSKNSSCLRSVSALSETPGWNQWA